MMNKFPMVEMLSYFTRFDKNTQHVWETASRHDLLRVRSCHSRVDGGVRKNYYTVDTKQGGRFDLIFNEQELIWSIDTSWEHEFKTIDRVVAHILRHKYTPSRAHRVIPYRFEILQEELPGKDHDSTEKSLIGRMLPYRFRFGKVPSSQVIDVSKRHMVTTMITRELHYVVKTDQGRFFHLMYILDEGDWRFVKELDGQLISAY